jgi:hypothetical protein
MIQAGDNTLHSEIHKLINSIWRKGELPEQLKKSTVVPNHKKSDKADCSNYQGISLLQIIYKILSRILQSRLTPYVGKIIWDQCGFRQNQRNTDQIFCIHQIPEEKKREYNETVHKLFTYLKKA